MEEEEEGEEEAVTEGFVLVVLVTVVMERFAGKFGFKAVEGFVFDVSKS